MDYFAPIRKRRAELEKDPEFIQEVLKKGAENARGIAEETMRRVRSAVGLR